MRVIVNENLGKKRATAAQRALMAGIWLLLLAVVLSFNMRYVLLAYGLMFAGIILTSWAARSGDKWLRKPRADQLLAKALKGVDHGHRLYSYSLPAQHVIFSPIGLFILKAKRQDGKISCRGEKWHRQFTVRRLLRLLAEEPLANPSKQVQSEMRAMHRFVADHLPDVDAPMQPVIVFLDPKAELDVMEPTVPTMLLGDLKAYLRSASSEKPMPKETQKALLDLFDEQAT